MEKSEEKNKCKKMKKQKGINAKISIIFTMLAIIVVTITALLTSNISKKTTTDPEILRSMEYDPVVKGQEAINGTEYVTFDAFFLRDLDNDGDAEGIRGTCRKVGESDTLYMELNVLTKGHIKSGTIKINNNNFYLKTAIPKDKIILENVIGNNVKEIKIGEIDSGTQIPLTGIVCSGDYSSSSRRADAIGKDISKYSSENSIVFDGILVEDGSSEEKSIHKEVKFNVDWHGTTKAQMPTYMSGSNRQDISKAINEEAGTFNVTHVVTIQEVNNELNIKKVHLEGEVPTLNGYPPIDVKITGIGDIQYDTGTRKFTITREATLDGNIITKQAYDGYSGQSRYNRFTFQITYPIEAYQSIGMDEVDSRMYVKGYYEGYNNTHQPEFTNPYVSNEVEGVFIITLKRPDGTIAIFDIKVGKYISSPSSRWVVSKKKPIRIYNGLSQQETDDNYLVTWIGSTGTDGKTQGMIMQEERLTGEKYEVNVPDYFIKNNGVSSTLDISMEDVSSYVGIYFSNPTPLLGSDGWIKVYDAETGEVLETFTSSNWNNYSANNMYEYRNPVKHIKVETSATNADSSISVYNVKQLDDDVITNTYDRTEFDRLQYIRSYLRGYLKGYSSESLEGSETGDPHADGVPINAPMGQANYEAPYSVAGLSIDKSMLSTQVTEKNVNITISALANEDANQEKWKNGVFLLQMPEDILDLQVNSVTAMGSVNITSYEKYVEDDIIYVKIYTENADPTTFKLNVNADITPNPIANTKAESIILYAYNENATDYWESNRVDDTFDLDSDFDNSDKVAKYTTQIELLSPASLLTNEVINKYDDKNSETIAPNVAEVSKKQGQADINIKVTNNYETTVTDVIILGRTLFTNNQYVINKQDLGSQFDMQMSKEGIKIPDNLKQYATVYYSDNPEATKDIKDVNNRWNKDINQVSQVKSYLIDLGDYELPTKSKYEFSYTATIPKDTEYNKVAYSHHAIYFSQNTDQGKYRTQTEPNKVGIMVARKYDLNLTKYQLKRESKVAGATYLITEQVAGEDGEQKQGRTKVTAIDGTLTLKDLYVGRTYCIQEIKTPTDYELNDDIIKFVVQEQENEELKVEILDGTIKDSAEIVEEGENGDTLKIKVEDEVRAKLKIVKKEKDSQKAVDGAVFKIAEKDSSQNERYITTNDSGEVTIRGLSIGKQYTIQEVKAEGYYLLDHTVDFTVINDNGTYKLSETSAGKEQPTIAEEDGIPTVTVNLENEKIPTYTLKLNKLVKGKEEPLAKAKFRLYKGDKKIADYVTKDDGSITLDNLYQFETSKGIEQTYRLKEILPPDGFVAVKDIIFKALKDENGQLTLEVTEGKVKETTIADNTITILVEDSPTFKLTKYAEDGKTVLPGVKFAIYNITDGKDEPAVDSKNNIVGTLEEIEGKEYYVLTTDEDGVITASLMDGLYKAVEVYAPDPKYDIVGNVYYFGVGASRLAPEGVEGVWSAVVGGTGTETITSIAPTVEGGKIAVGTFTGTIRVGETDLTATQTKSGIIVKYNKDGSVAWAKQIDGLEMTGITKGNSGYAIVGNFTGTITTDLGNEQATGLTDGAVLQINDSGTVQWIKKIGGEKTDKVNSIAKLNDGNYVVAVDFQSDNISVGSQSYTQKGTQDGLIVKLNSVDGNIMWSAQMGGTENDSMTAVSASKDGNALAVGTFRNAITVGSNSHTASGNADAIVIKYNNSNGDVMLSKQLGGDQVDSFDSIAGTTDGGFIAGGRFSSSNLAIKEDVISASSSDGIVVKYDQQGEIEWYGTAGGSNADYITSVAQNSDGTFIAGGYFGGTSIKVGKYAVPNTGTSRTDGLIIKYSAEGEVLCANQIGGTGDDQIHSVFETEDGNYVVGGSFATTFQYGEQNFANNGNTDGMLLELKSKMMANPVAIGATSVGSTSEEKPTALTYTSDGGYILAGTYKSTNFAISADKFANGEGKTFTNNATTNCNAIIIKYNSNDQIEWADAITGNKDEQIYDIQEKSEGGYIIKGHSNSSTITVGETQLQGDSAGKSYQIEYDEQGSMQKAEIINEDVTEKTQLKANTSDGGWVEVGNFKGTVTIGDYTLKAAGSTTDGKVVKYDKNGKVQWVKQIGGNGAEDITKVVVSENDVILVAGTFNNTFDVDGKTLTREGRTANLDIMVLRIENQIGIADEQEVQMQNDLKRLKITTKVKILDGTEKGGEITGEGRDPYESVLYGGTSEEEIKCTPNPQFEIAELTINGVPQEFTPGEDKTYKLEQFKNMTEDKHVVVRYVRTANKAIIKKIDTKTKKGIPNVKLKIERTDKTSTPIEITTDKNGQAILDLEYGSYQITEVETPFGYKPLKEPKTVDFSTGSTEIQVENEPYAKVTVHHYYKKPNGETTTQEVAPDDIITGDVGNHYSTQMHLDDLEEYEPEQDDDGYVIPDKASGFFTEDEIVVTYYYVDKRVPLTVHHYIIGTDEPVPLAGDEQVAQDRHSKGKVGESYTTYKLEYEATEHEDQILSPNYEFAEVEGEISGKYERPEIEVTYFYKERTSPGVVVHHVEQGSNKPLAPDDNIPDDGTEAKYGDHYDTHPSKQVPPNYELVVTPQNSSGTMDEDLTQVTYEYKLKDPDISEQEITKEGPKTLVGTDEEVTYTIDYTVNIAKYIGDVQVTIVDELPYIIDTERSKLDGGKYDLATHKITWQEYLKDINTYEDGVLPEGVTEEQEGSGDKKQITLTFTKTITVVFTNIDENVGKVVNKAKGKVKLYTPNKESEEVEDDVTSNLGTKIQIPVTKQWEDNSDQEHKRPTKVKILLKNKKDPSKVVQEKVLTKDENASSDNSNTWTYTFTELPKFNEDGSLAEYELEEQEETQGDLYYYESSINQEAKTITNTYVGPKIESTKASQVQHKEEVLEEIGPEYVQEGDTIKYIITVTNSGKKAKNVLIKDTIPEGLTLVANSIKVNDQTNYTIQADNAPDVNSQEQQVDLTGKTKEDLATGFTVTVPAKHQPTESEEADIPETGEVKGKVVLSFETTVDTLPEGTYFKQFKNKAIVDGKETTETTNTINKSDITFTKTAIPASGEKVKPGDEITYAITITNKGTAEDEVVVKDTIPQGTTFVEKSIKITEQDIAESALNPEREYQKQELEEGITVKVGAKKSVTLTFKVTVNKNLANGTQIENHAIIDEDKPTNKTTHTVIAPVIDVQKTQVIQENKNFVVSGDTITYNIVVTNSGELGQDIIIEDTLPAEVDFVDQSIKINEQTTYNIAKAPGTKHEGEDLQPGEKIEKTSTDLTTLTKEDLQNGIIVYVGEKQGNSPTTVTLSFSVTVKDAVTGTIKNVGTIKDAETPENPLDPEKPEEPGKKTPEVKVPIITFTKKAEIKRTTLQELEANQVTANDEITYKIVVTNTGEADAQNVQVKDNVPDGTRIKSVSAGGNVKDGKEITWTIDNIPANQSKEVSFQVIVNYSVKDAQITNVAYVDDKPTNQTTTDYKKPELGLETDVQKDGRTEKVTSRDTAVYYEITYTATIENFIGKAKITIVDQLPYQIDQQHSQLADGQYDPDAKTITWVIEVDDIDTYKSGQSEQITKVKTISLVYIYPDEESLGKPIENTVKAQTQLLQPNPDKDPEDPVSPDEVVVKEADPIPEDDHTVEVEIPGIVITHHYYYDKKNNRPTNIEVAPDVQQKDKVGTKYTTSKSDKVPKNYTCRSETPDGYEGTIKETTTEVTYYYELVDEEIDQNVTKTATANKLVERQIEEPQAELGEHTINVPVLTEDGGAVNYTIKYNVKISKYIGKVKITIVDRLPANIDTQKSELAGGKYNPVDQTITWEEIIEELDTYTDGNITQGKPEDGVVTKGTFEKTITKQLKLVYEDQNKLIDLVNFVEGSVTTYYPKFTPETPEEEKEHRTDEDQSTVAQEYKVDKKIEKIWDDNNDSRHHRPGQVKVQLTANGQTTFNGQELGNVILSNENDWTYTFENLSKYDQSGLLINYSIQETEVTPGDLEYYETPKITLVENVEKPSTSQSTSQLDKIIITNEYNLTSADLESSITKNGTTQITDETDEVTYHISYHAVIKDYIGEAVLTITDTLPYRIDKDKSKLSDGTYNNDLKTITWTQNLGHINTQVNGNKTVDFEKDITVVFTNIDTRLSTMTNNVKGRIEFIENDSKNEVEDNYDTDVKIVGKVVVKHVDKDTGEEIVQTIEPGEPGNETGKEPVTKKYGTEFEQNVGTEYTTSEENIPGYTYVDDSGNTTGKVEKGTTEVTYYYTRTPSKVTTKYVDEDGNEIAPEDVTEGKAGDEYTTKPKDLDDYEYYEVTGDDPSGKLTDDPKEVVYHYRRKPAKVVVRYLEKGTNNVLAEEDTIDGRIGDPYETSRKAIKGYKKADPEPKNAKGNMIKDPETNNTIYVTYYYERIPSGKVLVKYVDKETNEEIIYKDENGAIKEYGYEIEGYVDDRYTTQEKKIPYYEYMEELAPTNKDGLFKEDNQTVVYYYRKLEFNFSVDKKIKEATINGEAQKVSKDGKIMKLEIKSSKVSSAVVKVKYSIVVKNTGEIEGKATIKEMLPTGFKLAEDNPKYWEKDEYGNLITQVELKPGASKTLEVSVVWKNSGTNFGTMINKAQIAQTQNPADYLDINKEDDISQADVVMSIKTGAEVKVAVIALGTIAISGSLVLLYQYQKRQRRIGK